MREDVRRLLESFGVGVSAYEWMLDFSIQTAEQEICNDCHVPGVPKGLYSAAVYLAACAFLTWLKASAPDKIAGLTLDVAVKQIHEGDTTVTFALGEGSGTPEMRLDAFIQGMAQRARAQFAAYRRIAW